jgi:hypothetical protein
VAGTLLSRRRYDHPGLDRSAAPSEGTRMSAYKIISVVGTSSKSWEDATQSAVGAAAKSLRDLRIGKVTEMDVTVDKKGKVTQYRCKVDISFKYEI